MPTSSHRPSLVATPTPPITGENGVAAPQQDAPPSRVAELRHTSRGERKAIGKLARAKVPLAAHAELKIRKSGRDVVAFLEDSNAGRVEELVPLRHARMMVSPFTFYRGSAGLMAGDLASTPASGFRVQVCGDCHIHNIGVYATPERKLVADLNDFDETLPAPWEWDVKRMAASLVLAAATNGLPDALGREAAQRMAAGYREHMTVLAAMNATDAWYSHLDVERLLASQTSATAQRRMKMIEQARAKSAPEVLQGKLTIKGDDGALRFRDAPPLLSHFDGVSAGDEERQAFRSYVETLSDDRRVLLDKFELVDVALKVVGVGSVGTLCGILLLVSADKDVLILQLKEARASVLEPYAGPSRYAHRGQRVVNGQRLMQAASDMFLGWTTGVRAPHRHFFVRQLRDVKIGVNTALWSKGDFKTMPLLAGEILARAHARSGDATVLRGYLGKSEAFDEAIGAFGVAYAAQAERDYRQFVKACRSGRLPVQQLE
jgi:uncharacterized protein (DUF2252 family)